MPEELTTEQARRRIEFVSSDDAFRFNKANLKILKELGFEADEDKTKDFFRNTPAKERVVITTYTLRVIGTTMLGDNSFKKQGIGELRKWKNYILNGGEIPDKDRRKY